MQEQSSEGLACPAAPLRAAEALRAFEGQDFDLLVTAFQMPGMTGIDPAHAVRSRNPDFPVIVMTAVEPVECEHVTLWLPKEYLFPNLLEKIRYLPSWSQNGKGEDTCVELILPPSLVARQPRCPA